MLVKKIAMILAVTLLALGCAKKFDAPKLADFSLKAFEVSSSKGPLMLYVQNSENEYKFSLVNALGAPEARRVLKDGTFANLGFLPPNSAYNELFVKILGAIKSNQKEAVIVVNNENFKVRSLDIR